MKLVNPENELSNRYGQLNIMYLGVYGTVVADQYAWTHVEATAACRYLEDSFKDCCSYTICWILIMKRSEWKPNNLFSLRHQTMGGGGVR